MNILNLNAMDGATEPVLNEDGSITLFSFERKIIKPSECALINTGVELINYSNNLCVFGEYEKPQSLLYKTVTLTEDNILFVSLINYSQEFTSINEIITQIERRKNSYIFDNNSNKNIILNKGDYCCTLKIFNSVPLNVFIGSR